MYLSFLVPILLLASISAGVVMTGFAIWSAVSRQDKSRWLIASTAILGALTINSWWIAFAGMAFYKLFILREDT